MPLDVKTAADPDILMTSNVTQTNDVHSYNISLLDVQQSVNFGAWISDSYRYAYIHPMSPHSKMSLFPCSNNIERYKKMLHVMKPGLRTVYWDLVPPADGEMAGAPDGATIQRMVHEMHSGADFHYRSIASYLERNNFDLVVRCNSAGEKQQTTFQHPKWGEVKLLRCVRVCGLS